MVFNFLSQIIFMSETYFVRHRSNNKHISRNCSLYYIVSMEYLFSTGANFKMMAFKDDVVSSSIRNLGIVSRWLSLIAVVGFPPW